VIEDCDGGVSWQCSTHYRNPSHQYSEELRVFINNGAQRYTFGAYGHYQFVDINHVAPLFVQNAAGGVAGGVGLVVRGAQHSSGQALFANGEFDFADRFTLIAGIRASHDKKHIWHHYMVTLPVDAAHPWPDYTDTANVAYGTILSDDAFTDDKANGANRFSKNLLSGKIELDFRPTDGHLIYLSLSRGTKALHCWRLAHQPVLVQSGKVKRF
jgi:iron complex outermembrane recepter protein